MAMFYKFSCLGVKKIASNFLCLQGQANKRCHFPLAGEGAEFPVIERGRSKTIHLRAADFPLLLHSSGSLLSVGVVSSFFVLSSQMLIPVAPSHGCSAWPQTGKLVPG